MHYKTTFHICLACRTKKQFKKRDKKSSVCPCLSTQVGPPFLLPLLLGGREEKGKTTLWGGHRRRRLQASLYVVRERKKEEEEEKNDHNHKPTSKAEQRRVGKNKTEVLEKRRDKNGLRGGRGINLRKNPILQMSSETSEGERIFPSLPPVCLLSQYGGGLTTHTHTRMYACTKGSFPIPEEDVSEARFP